MSNDRPELERLRAALSGLVVIVFGVLIALGAEALWSERGDRLRERDLLGDLLEEFNENEARLLTDISANEMASAAAFEWVDAMTSATRPPPDSLQELFELAANDARFDPVTGAIRSLVDGGELALIRNTDLRRVLAGWTDRTAEARLTSMAWDNQRIELVPFVLSLEAGRELSSGEQTGLHLWAFSSGRVNGQLNAILETTRSIIAQIQAEIDR